MSIEALRQAIADRHEVYRNIDDHLRVTFFLTERHEGFNAAAFYWRMQALPESQTIVVRSLRVLQYTTVEVSYPTSHASVNAAAAPDAVTEMLGLAAKLSAALPDSAWQAAGVQPNANASARVLAWVVEILKDDLAFVAESQSEEDHRIVLRKPFLAMKRALAGVPQNTANERRDRAEKRLPGWWLGPAESLVKENPEWSDAKIAKMLGIHRGTLSKSKEYQSMAIATRRASMQFRKGFYDSTNHVSDGIVTDSESD